MDLVNILCLLFQIKTLGPCRDVYDNVQKLSDAFCVTLLDPLVSNTSNILTFVLLDIVVLSCKTTPTTSHSSYQATPTTGHTSYQAKIQMN